MAYKDINKKREQNRRWAAQFRANNPEKARARDKVYRARLQSEHPEKVRALRRTFYARHKVRLKEQRRAYFSARKAVKKEYDRQYRLRNLEKRTVQVKEWVKMNREHYNSWLREKRKINPQFAIANNMRGRINIALRKSGLKRNKSLEVILGCSVCALMQYLEARFLPGMTWANRSRWHIDHIKPCASFDLTDPDEQARCFHFTNLQPLWATDNIRKGDRIAA
jgi:hypothetical protein